MRVRPFCLRIRSVGAAGDIELPSRANGLQARQGVQDFRRKIRWLSPNINLFRQIPFVSLIDGRKSERVASLSNTAVGLLRDFFKSSSKALNFKKYSVGKVSVEPMILLTVRIRSLYVSGIAEYDGIMWWISFLCRNYIRL